MKICSSCETTKPLDEFSWKNKKKGIKSSKCKECHRVYAKTHYNNNSDVYKQRSKRDRKIEYEKGKKLLLELKSDGCIVCQEKRHHTLDFHHPDPTEKESNINQQISRKRMIEESKKCIILCSNCHRHEHYLLKQGKTQLK